jgi:hypothetical protein
MPMFSDVTAFFCEAFVLCACACSPRARCRSWCVGSIGSKIEVLTGRCDWPTVDHCAVAKVCGAANRGWLRKCE